MGKTKSDPEDQQKYGDNRGIESRVELVPTQHLLVSCYCVHASLDFGRRGDKESPVELTRFRWW